MEKVVGNSDIRDALVEEEGLPRFGNDGLAELEQLYQSNDGRLIR